MKMEIYIKIQNLKGWLNASENMQLNCGTQKCALLPAWDG